MAAFKLSRPELQATHWLAVAARQGPAGTGTNHPRPHELMSLILVHTTVQVVQKFRIILDGSSSRLLHHNYVVKYSVPIGAHYVFFVSYVRKSITKFNDRDHVVPAGEMCSASFAIYLSDSPFAHTYI